jgi:hypothetical protein
MKDGGQEEEVGSFAGEDFKPRIVEIAKTLDMTLVTGAEPMEMHIAQHVS